MDQLQNLKYTPAIHKYKRRETLEVKIGNTPLGGLNPIRLQSMTNTRTNNIEETVEQCIRIFNAGADYVRITAPTTKDAELLAEIKSNLVKKGYNQPLIADIHYSPNAAMIAAKHVEKIRINPGNFADKKKFAKLDYTDKEYAAEILRISERFSPLIKACKQYNTAMRIGVNHGSLSDRIMSRYGDTPFGMAESAMEFLRICSKHNYLDVVVSMKASNTLVMVQANRILAAMMDAEHLLFPIHLGVTEAGEGEDGRLKSAIGIGSLLADGIGDTIRVSLTEAPEKEIPVAQKIVHHIKNIEHHEEIQATETNPINPFVYNKRTTQPVLNIGGNQIPVVCSTLKNKITSVEEIQNLGFQIDENNQTLLETDLSPEYIFVENEIPEIKLPAKTKWIVPFQHWKKKYTENKSCVPLLNKDEFQQNQDTGNIILFVAIKLTDLSVELCYKLNSHKNVVLVLETTQKKGLAEQRRAFCTLLNQHCPTPVIIKRTYDEPDTENFQISAAIDTGSLFLDGLGDGIWLEQNHQTNNSIAVSTAFGILQASRVRVTKPEFISCPGCGRTLFNLEDTLAKIKKRTAHLKGLKIGVMGCIVNGIGEMADADYGYVGAGPGKITLYRNKEIVKKNLPEEAAVDELINLITENGDWIE